jgi:hypothetical protein
MKLRYANNAVFCVAILAIAMTGARYASAADAMGIWLFDDGEGAVALDSSGNGNDGTLMEGPAWISGQTGTALDFDGSAAYVDTGNGPSLEGGDEITLVAWVMIHGPGTGNGIIMLKGNEDGTPGASYGLVYGVGPQKLSFSLNTVDTGWADHNSDATADPDVWTHVAGTYKPGELILYVNGMMAAPVWDHRDTSIAVVTGPLYIGRENSWALEQFFGAVDEVGVFANALSQSEIQDIMNGGLAQVVTAVEPEGKLGATWGRIKSATR